MSIVIVVTVVINNTVVFALVNLVVDVNAFVIVAVNADSNVVNAFVIVLGLAVNAVAYQCFVVVVLNVAFLMRL